MTKKMVDSAETSDVIAFRRAFDDEMMSRIADKIELKKSEVTSKIFDNPTENTEVDDFEDQPEVQDGDSNEED